MIDKETAKKSGARVMEGGTAASVAAESLKENLHDLLPALINADGQLDVKALRDLLTPADTTSNNQGYELTFAGKGLARYVATTPTEKELAVEAEQSKNFDETRNVVIRGDNLDALKLLQANYHERVKLIYIDPPYNKEKENFTYRNNFRQTDKELIEKAGLDEDTIDFLHNLYSTGTHSGWLAFIYPRLALARDLLHEDGAICVSIDDDEQHNLRAIMDEIFGASNFVAQVVWNGMDTVKNDARYFSENHEYILVYAKNKDKLNIKGARRTEEQNSVYRNPDNDERGPYLLTPLHAKSGKETDIYEYTFPNGVKWQPPQGRHLSFTPENLLALYEDNRIYFGKDGKAIPQKKTFLSEVGEFVKLRTLWHYKFAGSTRQSNKELSDLLGKAVFSDPKPSSLIKILCEAFTIENDIVLDFFAGSGTTGDAVMQLNAEDFGKRKFILVQQDEEIDKEKNPYSYNFCKELKLEPIISSICIERINRAGEKVKEEKNGETALLDIGYKVFRLMDKPSVMEDGLKMQIHNPRKTALDVLFNMLAVREKPLDTQIETIVDGVLYEADGEAFLLADISPEQLEKYRNTAINLDGWAEISLDQYLNLGVGSGADNIFVIY